MRRITKAAAALVLAAGTMAGVGTTAAGAASAAPAAAFEGCPSNDVCLYPGADWNGGSPMISTSDDGTIISTGHSVQRVLNNRTDGTLVHICESVTSCTTLAPGAYIDYHFTSNTSIRVGD